MSHGTSTPPPAASTADQVDCLVGMLLEAGRGLHVALGFPLATFDFDRLRGQLYATAAAQPGRSSRADRYRALARRGSGRSTPMSPGVDRRGSLTDSMPPCAADA
jgi:hypothetical protein